MYYVITKDNIEIIKDVFNYFKIVKYYIDNDIKYKTLRNVNNYDKLLDIKKELKENARASTF